MVGCPSRRVVADNPARVPTSARPSHPSRARYQAHRPHPTRGHRAVLRGTAPRRCTGRRRALRREHQSNPRRLAVPLQGSGVLGLRRDEPTPGDRPTPARQDWGRAAAPRGSCGIAQPRRGGRSGVGGVPASCGSERSPSGRARRTAVERRRSRRPRARHLALRRSRRCRRLHREGHQDPPATTRYRSTTPRWHRWLHTVAGRRRTPCGPA